MNNKEAKEALEAMAGLIFLVKANGCKLTPEINTLCDNYLAAKDMAKEALDLMDRQIDIEKEG